jgi:hypothetical protein
VSHRAACSSRGTRSGTARGGGGRPSVLRTRLNTIPTRRRAGVGGSRKQNSTRCSEPPRPVADGRPARRG